nr:anti-SIV gp148 Ig heavy chain {CDR3 heavy chain region} [Macaca fascicularis=cynomolgus monkey, Peptide Partial, 24 aa] [Macaca fascicularis]
YSCARDAEHLDWLSSLDVWGQGLL